MIPKEIEPLFKFIDCFIEKIKGKNADTIIESLLDYKSKVHNDFTAKKICTDIQTLCHVKSWGDRYIEGIDWNEWLKLLNSLKSKCIKCFNKIEQRIKNDI